MVGKSELHGQAGERGGGGGGGHDKKKCAQAGRDHSGGEGERERCGGHREWGRSGKKHSPSVCSTETIVILHTQKTMTRETRPTESSQR